MNNGQKKINAMDIIRAKNGDKDAIQKILNYFCDCTDREISPDVAVLSYLAERFQSYLNGSSLEKAFMLIGEEGRPKGESLERNAILVAGVLFEKSKKLNNIEAFANVADRHFVSDSVVKRAWEEKPDDDSETPIRYLLNDSDIDAYERLFIISKASS